MKKTKSIALIAMGILIITIVTLAFSSCKEHTPGVAEVNRGILSSHPWKINRLEVDNTDQTSLYTNMVLTFTGSSYTCSNGFPVWPSNGTWTLSDDGFVIKRSDISITIEEISDSKLVLGLDWAKSTFSGGRKGSIQGHHVFTFIK